jgi:GrpB-like predicted nucleotidyltransferase (UPF0157 family)
MNERISIELHPYDATWPTRFAEEAQLLRRTLAVEHSVHHVGSTSVPGLSAKPIIDIVLEVPDSAQESTYVPALEAAGYTFTLREPEWFQHRLMKRAAPAINLHVFSAGCIELGRMLTFRDWLRSHDKDRRLYERTKQNLAARAWANMDDYASAKTEVVSQILNRALR